MSQPVSADTEAAFQPPPRVPIWRPIAAGTIGNAIEWFDWSIYTAFAIYFGHQFFPTDNPTSALLATFAVFAVGFGMRPIGGYVIGVFNDRVGRRAALTLTIAMMTLPSLVISILPSYDTIGLAAPILLVLARLVQGLSVGGEYGAAATFIAETAAPARRGFYSGFMFASIALGLLAASGLAWILSELLDDGAMAAYGWRIPFFVGGLCGLAGLWIRRGVEEPKVFQEAQGAPPLSHPLRTLWRDHPEALRRIVGISLLGAFAFYLFISYIPVHAIRSAGATPSVAYGASTVSLLIFMLSQPLFGWVSDRLGRRPQLIVFALAYALFLTPVIDRIGSSFGSILLVELFGLLFYGLYSAIAPAIKSELFSTDIRALGIGLPYNLVVAIFGGTTPYLMTWLQSRGHEDWFLYYVSAAAVISLITFVRMPETRGASLR